VKPTRSLNKESWEKLSQILHDLAFTGRSTALELLSDKNDYRFIDILSKEGWIEKHSVGVLRSVQILLVRLSQKGINVGRSFGWEVKESEWSRLIRLHEKGNGSEKHTASILWFTYQARRRGWQVDVMPDLGDPLIAPDLRVTKKNQTVLVEVEMQPHRNWEKWRSIGRFTKNQRAILGICAITSSIRYSLVREASWMAIGGMATDLQTISKGRNNSLLWLESWN
jgi:hypothetical protein